ncbi:MAG: protein arginine kinase [Kiritimatiellae bacterium]|nr:protein arginine kinase [Kiritimatiellia bacterium]MCO5067534.1 protein arginine kinase [Kiritimatiellia bacterium]
MTITDLMKQPSAWLAVGGGEGPVVSSRIRLARNVRDAAFPGWAGEEECDRLWKRIQPIMESLPCLKPSFSLAMESLDELQKQILFERHLISREHAEKKKGSGLVFRGDETLSAMVNEEDHLRLQGMRPGLSLRAIWQEVNQLDNEVEEQLRYAFSPKLGYLTACPTNVGTGMRASVMLHLPGMVLMNEIGPVIKGMGKIGLAVRGLWGEGTEAAGNMFQISNQMTLGDSEEQILTVIDQIVRELIDHERNARERLMERRETILRDHVGRSFGILANAHFLTSKEAMDLLSGLRLGIDLGILTSVSGRVVDELLLLTQPGHLQQIEDKALKPKERDRHRARLVREKLSAPPKRRGSRTANE